MLNLPRNLMEFGEFEFDFFLKNYKSMMKLGKHLGFQKISNHDFMEKHVGGHGIFMYVFKGDFIGDSFWI